MLTQKRYKHSLFVFNYQCIHKNHYKNLISNSQWWFIVYLTKFSVTLFDDILFLSDLHSCFRRFLKSIVASFVLLFVIFRWLLSIFKKASSNLQSTILWLNPNMLDYPPKLVWNFQQPLHSPPVSADGFFCISSFDYSISQSLYYFIPLQKWFHSLWPRLLRSGNWIMFDQLEECLLALASPQ